MNIFASGQNYEMNPENTWFLEYENDLLDGVFHDIDEENFIFISRHAPAWHMVADDLAAEGVGTYGFTEINACEPPHCWIIASIGRLIVDEARSIVDGE